MTTPPPSHPSTPSPPDWSEQGRLLLDLALSDLAAGDGVRPTMVAFRGDEALFLATLRPFAAGEHHDPILEVGAVAVTLGADRLLLSLGGRAWSLHDPIPPVLPDGPDLRQQVIVLHRAEADGAEPLCLTTVVPVDVDADADADGRSVTPGPALTDIAGRGWVPQALLAMVGGSLTHHRRREELAAQVVRCERLGHQLAWGEATLQEVALARAVWLCHDQPSG